MKVLSILTFTAVVAIATCMNVTKLFAECMEELKLSREELTSFYTNGMRVSDATEGVKCHLKCMFDKTGLFKDGVFDVDVAIAMLLEKARFKGKDAQVEFTVKACMTEKGPNDCETAFLIIECMNKNAPR